MPGLSIQTTRSIGHEPQAQEHRTQLLASREDASVTLEPPEQALGAQLEAVLDHLKRVCGFKVRARSGAAGASATTPKRPDRVQDPSAEARKARALWLFLHHLGAVKDPSERALTAYAKRIAGIEALQWARGDRMHDLIETLKKWAMRPPYLPLAISTMKAEVQARFRAGQLSDEQIQAARAAQACLNAGSGAGFDLNWGAFQHLQDALRPQQRANIDAQEGEDRGI